MNLCIDIGNTFTKMAIFNGQEMCFFKSKKKWLVADLKSMDKKYPFDQVILSSVKKSMPSYWPFLKRTKSTYILGYKLPIPITNQYKTPKTLGNDRLAAVIGAHDSNPKKNNVVIDIGTCVKMDYIDKQGNYWGGNIAPGVELRLKSMHHFTDKLPSVKKKTPVQLLGKSTKEAMNNGAVFGVAMEIEAFISRIKAQNGTVNVILTGGGASFFGEIVKSKIFVDSFLVLKGLNKTLDYQKNIS